MTELSHRVRMPLLTLITQQSLDEDYQVAAALHEARQAGGAPRRPRSRAHRTTAVVAAVFALMVTVAAVQTRQDAPIAQESRSTLIDQVDAQKRVVASQQVREARLTDRNAVAQRALSSLTDDVQTDSQRVARLEATTGFAAVHGPGVRFTVRSAPGADQNQAVRDTDLSLLVAGLWTAGAEAVSINGQRLSTLGGIHTSGPAIYVGDNGIAPPYVVSAIGDPRTLQARFYDTSTGLDFAALARQEGFELGVDNVDDMTLPAAPPRERVLRSTSTDLQAHGPVQNGGR